MAHRFHPDFKFVRFTPKTTVTPRTLRLSRAMFRAMAALYRPWSETVTPPDGRETWIFRPKAPTDDRVLFWIHGGGLIFGHPLQDRSLYKRIMKQLGTTIVAPCYRFAPEHPYPAALDDLCAAYDWLLSQPGMDPVRIIVGGDSAGGGLAAALAIALRDRGTPLPAQLILHEPMLDEATRRRPDPDPDTLRSWGARINRFAWDGYLSGTDDAVPPTASPARLGDATGLPPTWIGVGTEDLFHEECVAFADLLRRADILTGLEIVTGAFHGFTTMAPRAAVTRAYVDAMLGVMRRSWESRQTAA